MPHFIKQTAFPVEYAPAHITKWRSLRTGLQLTYINQASPVVNGFFAVATEIADDSGAPHTLEHLVFMGSNKYPYKGLLDTLGNRLYSSTNAWTAVDQTVYTLTTAGWDGFKTLLPIYLDHLFHPTLTDDACLTEVYHIDGKGKEKGVVFSEMQGIEAQLWFQTNLAMQRLLYPPLSGYSSETGGLMSELRKLGNERIRQFHRDMYRPDNLCVIITGSVDEEELLQIMETFDAELNPYDPSKAKPRPFVDSVHEVPLAKSIIEEVEFPDDDESMGEMICSWIGPLASDTLTNTALEILGSYLCDSAISLLNKNFVEIENPLATDIDFSTDDYYRTTINLIIGGVPTAKLLTLDQQLKELISLQTEPTNFDLEYIRQLIDQTRLKIVSRTEKSPSDLANIALDEFLYGDPSGCDLKARTADLKDFEQLLSWSLQQWCDLVKLQLVDNHSASVLGKPSRALMEAQKARNRQIAKEIKSRYGKEGLLDLQNRLDIAQKHNDTPIPDSLLRQFDMPDPSKIAFIQTRSYVVGDLKELVDLLSNEYTESDKVAALLESDCPPAGEMPLFLHYEDFKSQFTTISLVMSSSVVDEHLLKYMSIVEEIFAMSVQLKDRYIPYTDVISELNNDLVEFQLDNGYENQFLELINIKVKFESGKYRTAIDWLIAIMCNTVFEESRIKVIVEKIVNSMADKKRNGELMMYSCQYRRMFSDRSLRKAQDSINTEAFYKDLLLLLENGENGFARVKADLEKLTHQLFSIDNIKVFILGNVENLELPVSSWSKFVKAFGPKDCLRTPFAKLPRSVDCRSSIGEQCKQHAFLVSSPAAELTHLVTLTLMPHRYLDEDIFKIALASEFLTAVEGPFWRGIRGTGLAYGASIRRNVETGYLSFSLYRAADPKQAWLTAKKIVQDYSDGTLTIDSLSIENAVAAIINLLANAEDNSYDAATSKISDNVFKRRGPHYNTSYLAKLNQLTANDVKCVLSTYFSALFSSEKSVVFASVPAANAEDMSEFIQSMGYVATIEVLTTEASEHDDGSSCASCESHDETDSCSEETALEKEDDEEE